MRKPHCQAPVALAASPPIIYPKPLEIKLSLKLTLSTLKLSFFITLILKFEFTFQQELQNKIMRAF